jgi:transcriptional regulator with XRE-family HTH domain
MYVAGKCLLLPLLNERGISQKQCADKARMKATQINDYIHNRRIMSFENAKTISEAIGCNMNELYEWIHVKR